MTDHTLAPTIAQAMEECSRYVFAPLPFYLPGCSVRLTGDGPSSWTQWIIVGRTTKQHRWGTLPGGYTGTGKEWRDRVHMGGKPTGLMRALVNDYSRPGETVLDPFAGSGTTGVACVQTGRNFVGVELSPEYHAIAERRIAEAKGAA
jgi:site-specific DNA-methyltransferase (adenine-specific)